MLEFSVDVTRNGTEAIVWVTGEIDLATAPDLATAGLDAIASEGLTDLIVDMSEVAFIDSTGIAALIRMRHAAITKGRVMRLRAVPEQARRALAITGLEEHFRIDHPEDTSEPALDQT